MHQGELFGTDDAASKPDERTRRKPAARPDPEESSASSADGATCFDGPRAVERRLFAELDALLGDGAAALAQLARPVLVVVPSRSLRTHVLCAYLRHRGGRAAAGLRVVTLHGLALEVLERTSPAAAGAPQLFAAFTARELSSEPDLRAELEGLDGAWRAVAASAADLIDAGLDEASLEAALELLGERRDPSRRRAAATLQLAARVRRSLAEVPGSRATLAYGRAAEALEGLPAPRAVFVHGFSDATGAAAQWLEALRRRWNARFLLDVPQGPESARDEPGFETGLAFTAPFAERLGLAPPRAPSPSSAARLELFTAPGATTEVRETAQRIRARLDAGVAPELIGVVARRLDGYRVELRRELGRLGVPFSGVGTRGALTALGRRVHALLDLLKSGEEAPVDRWLDALEPRGWRPRGEDGEERPFTSRVSALRLAMRGLGCARLKDWLALDLDQHVPLRDAGTPDERKADYLPLPLRRRMPARSEGQGGNEFSSAENDAAIEQSESQDHRPRGQSSRVELAVLVQAQEAARRLAARGLFKGGEVPVRRSLRELSRTLFEDLGWRTSNTVSQAIEARLADLARSVPEDLALGRLELGILVGEALGELGYDELGGRGGGVQVLDVTEARGRTFDELFVLGMNRDVFPRAVSEDPLLPEALRAELRALLPDLPLKARGHLEERYLFAQLLGAAEHVTLSWQGMDEDGKALAVSPLRSALHPTRCEGEPPVAAPAVPRLASTLSNEVRAGRLERPAHELAVLVAQHGDERALAACMEQALTEELAPLELPHLRAADVSRARLAVAREHDASFERPGPYFGYVGPLPQDKLYVTHLERLSGCGWQYFLERVLRLEVVSDPLEALPGVDARMLGILVHDIIESVVHDALPARPADLREALAGTPVTVTWPGVEEVTRRARARAAEVLRAEGIGLAGMAEVLVQRALPMLADVVDIEESAGHVAGTLGAEVGGELALDVGGRKRTLRFRADRVDVIDGERVLTDYKTGRSLSEAVRPATRVQKLREAVRRGQKLQAAAYAYAEGADRGRYLYLKPGTREEGRAFDVPRDQALLRGDFDAALEPLFGALDRGVVAPRLVKQDRRAAYSGCRWCELSQACLQGDSGARRRLLEHVGTSETPGADELSRWWHLEGAPIEEPEGAKKKARKKKTGRRS